VLQFCFCAVSLAHGPFELSKIPWFVYFIAFSWPIVLMPVQELVKMHDNKEFTRFQKRSKLEFSTKVTKLYFFYTIIEANDILQKIARYAFTIVIIML
jgi:hypothetical protein